MYQIEREEYRIFLNKFNSTKPQHLRLGQAFYQNFGLHKLANQTPLDRLYNADYEKSVGLIHELFEFV